MAAVMTFGINAPDQRYVALIGYEYVYNVGKMTNTAAVLGVKITSEIK